MTGAILMLLNADEVKMCLKEQIPAGRAAAYMHGVMNTHMHTQTHMHACTCAHGHANSAQKETWMFL